MTEMRRLKIWSRTRTLHNEDCNNNNKFHILGQTVAKKRFTKFYRELLGQQTMLLKFVPEFMNSFVARSANLQLLPVQKGLLARGKRARCWPLLTSLCQMKPIVLVSSLLCATSLAYPTYKFALYRGTADTKDACGAGGQRGKCFVWALGAHPNCYKFSETESYSGAVFNETSLTYDLHPRSTDCSSGKGAGRKGTSLGSCTFFSYGGVYWLKLECVLLDSASVCPADYVECTDCVTGCDRAISPPAPTTPQVPVMPQVPAMPQAPTRPEKAPTKPQGPKTRAETPDVAPAEISSAAYLLVNWSVLVAMAFMSVHAFV